VSALLAAEQLRVFKDRDGHLAGRPFDQALARAIMESATFTPVITLAGTQLLATVTESSVDCAPALSVLSTCHIALALTPCLSQSCWSSASWPSTSA
jgi:hypothetical protein